MVDQMELKGFADGRTILLMEDNEINAMIASNQLTSAGFNVKWGADGAQGVEEYLNSDAGHFCCVITDLMMPTLDGTETAKKSRNSGRTDCGLPILAITANAYAGKFTSPEETGINKCLLKPYNKNELLEWVYYNIMEYEAVNVSGN